MTVCPLSTKDRTRSPRFGTCVYYFYTDWLVERVYFTPRAYTRTCISYTQCRGKVERICKDKVEWTWNVRIRKGEGPGGRRRVPGHSGLLQAIKNLWQLRVFSRRQLYSDLLQAAKREPLTALGSQQRMSKLWPSPGFKEITVDGVLPSAGTCWRVWIALWRSETQRELASSKDCFFVSHRFWIAQP